MSVVYLNGEWVDAEHARISIFDRGFLFGDGVFETGRLHRGRFFRLDQHLARLEQSGAQLGLRVPELPELLSIAEALVERNRFSEASLRITVTRGSGGRGLTRKGAGPPTIVGTLSETAADWETRAAKGWSLRLASTRRPSTDSVPAQLKALGRIYALLAHFEAEDAGADDALLLSADGFIAEGPTWNFFWRAGRTIYTPALEAGVLEGVTRRVIIELARQEGYEVKEGRFPAASLADAEEAFATMTSNGVVPITSLDDRPFSASRAAPKLQAAYWALVRAETGQTE